MEPRLALAEKAYIAARERIQACISQINYYAESDEKLPFAHERDEHLEGVKDTLQIFVERAILAIEIVFELLDLHQARRSFKQGLVRFKNKYSEVDYFEEYFGPHVPAVDYLNEQINALAPLLEKPTNLTQKRDILIRVLRNFPQYLEDCSVYPKNEKMVQDHLLRVLRLPFPDVIREPPIPKQTKTYHPDFGIESIATAIEVKFVPEKKLAAPAIGAIYEDMQGYANSDYSAFVAFVYMAGNYLTQSQVDAELKKVNASKAWRVVLVVGGINKANSKTNENK